MMYDLNGKVVLITGGASGIGFSCVKEILRAGAIGVTIVDINQEIGKTAVDGLVREFGTEKVIFVKADVTQQDQFEEAFKKTLSVWNRIDVVINNAATFNDKQWEFEITVNTTSTVRGTLLGLQYMGKDKGGKGGVIVNVSSTLGLHGKPALPIYTGTKHFVVGFSRTMGTPYHYDCTGVKVVTICPGYTITPLSHVTRTCKELYLSPDFLQQYREESEGAVGQPPEIVAEGVLKSIREGNNGSVWVADKNEIYEISIPDRESMRRLL